MVSSSTARPAAPAGAFWLLAGAAAAAAWWVRRRKQARGAAALPLALTVHRPITELADELGQHEERLLADSGLDGPLELAAAPGTFGTEIRVRVPEGDGRTRSQARQSLRLAKQLLETGSTMPPDRPVTRRRTVTSIPLEVAIRRAGKGGRL
jgi:hypothetical protein